MIRVIAVNKCKSGLILMFGIFSLMFALQLKSDGLNNILFGLKYPNSDLFGIVYEWHYGFYY